MPIIQAENMIAGCDGARHCDLDPAVQRDEAPGLRLLLAHHQTVAEGLLPLGASERAGPAPRLDGRQPQRRVVQSGAPQGVVRRDAQPQSVVVDAVVGGGGDTELHAGR